MIGDDVAWRVVFGVVRDRESAGVTFEKFLECANAAMVDAFIAVANFGFMHEFLKVDAKLAICADHNVGANTVERRDIAHRIR